MALTAKQQKFVDEYFISGNATDAARLAGYSKKTCYSIGNENLKKPEIIAALREKEKEIQDKNIAKQEEVLTYLTSIMRGEQSENVLIGIGNGKQKITKIKVSAKDRIKAAELLGKRYGIWTEKQEISIEPTIISGDDKLED